jgi:predicted secreted protein
MRTFEGSATTIRVQVGEIFALALEAQPTSGYTWQATVDSQYLALEEQRFEPGGPALGAAGRERLVFRALQAGRWTPGSGAPSP